jgi:hypothetical protein
MAEQEKDQKKEPAFRVSDRRRFAGADKQSAAEEGAPRKEERPEAAQVKQDPRPEAEPKAQAAKEDKRAPRDLPPVNFATFVISLSSSALIHLGLAEDPVTGKIDRDLALARQTIDILGMLQEKTRGNLSEDESRLLESILFDLRIRFVEEAGKAGS